MRKGIIGTKHLPDLHEYLFSVKKVISIEELSFLEFCTWKEIGSKRWYRTKKVISDQFREWFKVIGMMY